MRILIIINSLAGGGAEKLISDLAPRFMSDKHSVEILVMSGENSKYADALKEKGIHVAVLSTDSHIKRIFIIRKYIRRGNFDVVHANLFPVIYYVILSSLFLRGKPLLVMTEHSTDNKRRRKEYLRPIEKFIYRHYDRIIRISPMAEKNLQSWLRLPEKYNLRFHIVDNGISTKEYAEKSGYDKTEIFPDIRKDDILLGMVGSFSQQKNHKGMLHIMAVLPEKYKLVLVGEGPLILRIRDKAAQMGLSRRISILGYRKDIAEIFHTIDILVIPSLWEGFGLIAVEAMACGTPVVASNVPGLAGVVADCGLLAEPTNIEEFALQIQRLEDTDLYCDFVNKGRKRAERFDISNTVKGYEKIYKGES